MKEKEDWYNRLLVELEYRYPPLSGAHLGEIRARRLRKPLYALSVLGNALAQERGWLLTGMDAIDFALISKYSWFPPQVRDLSPANKWLALHEDLHRLEIDPLALEVWNARYPGAMPADLLDWAASSSGLPPVEDTDPSHE